LARVCPKVTPHSYLPGCRGGRDVPILTSDVYEWAPGGFFVVHSAFGKIGETSVGGVEIIGVDGPAGAGR
jgi:hypothetical protein